MASKLGTGEIFFSSDETRLIRKIYLVDQEGHVPNSLWLAKDSGSSRSGNLDLKSIVPTSKFTTSKPIALLKRVFTVADTEDALILDYFAGSGATGHAVLALNREDGGRRKFILVEMGDYFAARQPVTPQRAGLHRPKLKVKRPGSDESREVSVDLLETFNWLIGLTVRHITASQEFTAAFERDSEKRLRMKSRLT